MENGQAPVDRVRVRETLSAIRADMSRIVLELDTTTTPADAGRYVQTLTRLGEEMTEARNQLALYSAQLADLPQRTPVS